MALLPEWRSFCLGLGSSQAHTCAMTDTHVIFSAEKVPRGYQMPLPWGKIDFVTGFLDEQSIQNWLATEHRDHWLKVRGYHP
jgi:hypothetical protein